MNSIVQALREQVALLGWPLALLYVAHRALERLSGGRARIVPYRVVAQPVGRGSFGVSDSPDTIVRRADSGDALLPQFPRPAPVNERRWGGGAVCHLAQVKGEFAGTIWIQRDRYDEDEVRCLYELGEPDRSVWDFDVYIQPKYRFGRTMARMWKSVDRQLAADGVEWSFSRISLFNPASLNSHARLGAVGVATLVFVAAGPLQLCLMDRRPGVHLSWTARRRPHVRLLPPGRA